MVQPGQRLIVFDAFSLRGLALNDGNLFPDELSAFRLAFRGRRFRMLVTDGILREYTAESTNRPQFLPVPTLTRLSDLGRAIFRDESQLARSPIDLPGLPREHRAFVIDAIAAGASYFITKYLRWLGLTDRTETSFGLSIVSPARFVELEV